ncbi:MAG: hypothetical protein RIQ79_1144 [Verrucomicrobiota bacterium]
MFRLPFHPLRLLLAVVCCTVSALAQSAHWEPAGGSLPRDQVSQLALLFENCEPSATPVLPATPALEFGNPGRNENSSFSLNLGSKAVSNRTITYTYPVRPRQPDGEVRIPAFTIKTDAGNLTVPAAGYRIVPATLGQTGLGLEEIVKARFIPPADPVWAGEVFPLRHTLEIDTSRAYQAAPNLEWNAPPLTLEEWSAPKKASTPSLNYETRTTRALAAQSGKLTLPSASLLVGIATGTDIFGRPVGDRYNISTAPVTLEVRPLPSPAPADFAGAVGKFTLESKAVPLTAAVGEPVTWTLALAGTGNWPALTRLPPRSLSRDFRVITPRAQKTPKDNSLFDASLAEDLVLIPTKAGPATLPALTLSVFNPATGAYETLRTEPITLTITPAANVNPGPAPSPSTNASTPPSADPAAIQAPAPPPFTPLPGDPIASTASSARHTPLTPRAVLLVSLSMILLPVGFWLALAARRARRLDPLLPRRQAHARLAALTTEIESSASSPAALPALLLAWQNELRTLFALPATPSSRDLPDAVWSALWLETERVLYRPATALSTEWPAQVRAALARATPKPFSPLALFRPAHLFVRAALWFLVLHSAFVISHSSFAAAATTPAASYAAGDFTASTKLWREQLAAAPADWTLHHNLALSLAQQNAWDEAAAHAALAALYAPQAEAPRRLLALILPHATYRPAFTDLFPAPRPSASVLLKNPSAFVGLLSPRTWQLLVVASALLAALALCARLAAAYGTAPRLLRPLGNGGLLLAVLTLATALLALRIYAPVLPSDTVLVWQTTTLRSVPTEAGEPQKTTTLTAGTLARTDKTFLGWRRLILDAGTTGWTRSTPLLPLWPEAPSKP